MTMKEIESWVSDRIYTKNRLVRNDEHGAKYVFENGDSYEIIDRENGLFEKTVQTLINGVLVNETVYTWENFGWKTLRSVIV